MKRLRFLGLALLAGAGLLMAAPASAACTVNPQGVNFGRYDTLDPAPRNGAGNISINCTFLTLYTVSLGTGAGTFQSRKMSAGRPTRMTYNLYSDATRLLVWGDGSLGALSVTNLAVNANLPVYGRIPARQALPSGLYSDTIIVTVSF